MTERRVVLTGTVTVDSAHAWLDRYPVGEGEVVVDAAALTACDSALIALLLAWLRRAQREGVALRVVSPPDSVVQLAEIYGVAPLLFR